MEDLKNVVTRAAQTSVEEIRRCLERIANASDREARKPRGRVSSTTVIPDYRGRSEQAGRLLHYIYHRSPALGATPKDEEIYELIEAAMQREERNGA